VALRAKPRSPCCSDRRPPGTVPSVPARVFAMSAHELLSTLVEAVPAPAPVEPFAFVEDDLLPLAFTPVEPTAFALACVQALWGARGPRN